MEESQVVERVWRPDKELKLKSRIVSLEALVMELELSL